jgi:hypothetical protein
MIKKIILVVLICIVFLILNGCMNVRIESDVDYPHHLFKKALKEIKTIQAEYPNRKGPVHRINLLVYTGDDRQLVTFSVGKAMAEWAMKQSDMDDEKDFKKYSKKYGNIRWQQIKDLDRMGPGLLVEVEIPEENTHIIIWLD